MEFYDTESFIGEIKKRREVIARYRENHRRSWSGAAMVSAMPPGWSGDGRSRFLPGRGERPVRAAVGGAAGCGVSREGDAQLPSPGGLIPVGPALYRRFPSILEFLRADA